uniref:Uncharacterized protein n=1 Tax=Myripristis murdjan TaxID=586833 RepID=A0A667YK66_9TELE
MSLVYLGKRLLEAARAGQDDDVRTLMANGAPFTTDWLGTSPLHLAAQYGHHSTAEVLLRAGVSRDARTKVDRTPLHMAATEGHSSIVELLVRSGADINAKDMLKMTALHWAAQHGHREVAELLLRYGADVHSLSKFDKTPFDIAMDTSNTELMILLQDGMQNQVNMNPQHQYIIPAGRVLNLSDLVTNTKTSTEDAIAAESVDTALQHMVGDGSQRVITIVTDQHGNLQPASFGQQFFVTMQGQQMVALPASAITEEVVEEEPQLKGKDSRELLQRQLQEANRKAQEYRQQLLQKEQEAELYRLRLEQAMAVSNSIDTDITTGTAATVTAVTRSSLKEVVGEQLEIAEGAAVQESAEDRVGGGGREEGEERVVGDLPDDAILVNEGELDVTEHDQLGVEGTEGTDVSPGKTAASRQSRGRGRGRGRGRRRR